MELPSCGMAAGSVNLPGQRVRSPRIRKSYKRSATILLSDLLCAAPAATLPRRGPVSPGGRARRDTRDLAFPEPLQSLHTTGQERILCRNRVDRVVNLCLNGTCRWNLRNDSYSKYVRIETRHRIDSRDIIEKRGYLCMWCGSVLAVDLLISLVLCVTTAAFAVAARVRPTTTSTATSAATSAATSIRFARSTPSIGIPIMLPVPFTLARCIVASRKVRAVFHCDL